MPFSRVLEDIISVSLCFPDPADRFRVAIKVCPAKPAAGRMASDGRLAPPPMKLLVL